MWDQGQEHPLVIHVICVILDFFKKKGHVIHVIHVIFNVRDQGQEHPSVIHVIYVTCVV